jgi:hypothetical protein
LDLDEEQRNLNHAVTELEMVHPNLFEEAPIEKDT